jgi:hypothetical protein
MSGGHSQHTLLFWWLDARANGSAEAGTWDEGHAHRLTTRGLVLGAFVESIYGGQCRQYIRRLFEMFS